MSKRQEALKAGRCPDCANGRVEYRGDYGAPGYGQCWECNVCGSCFTKLGPDFVEYVPEFTAGDVE